MPLTTSKIRSGQDETITLRVSRSQKVLLDWAARATGQTRSKFVVESACREAEDVLLDRCDVHLPKEKFKRFVAMLDNPPARNPRLARLLKTKAPWGFMS